jgi:DNA-binding transcriptional LysR family regulator
MLRELQTLLAIAREGTFASAGDKVGLTQAAVSAQVQRLEADLGFSLFDRSARAARLNPRGHQVVEQARELVRLYGELGSRKAGAAAEAVVSVGAIASVQRSLLPDVLAKFFRESAQRRVRVVPGVSSQLFDAVDAGKLDMALVIRPPFALQRELRWTTLAREPYRLLVPRSVRGTDAMALLAAQPFIRYDRESFGGRQVDRFLRDAHVQVREACELDELEAIVALVAKGAGIALAPQTENFRRWPAGVRAIDLRERTFHREVGLVHRASHGMSGAALRLVELIFERSRVQPASGRRPA